MATQNKNTTTNSAISKGLGIIRAPREEQEAHTKLLQHLLHSPYDPSLEKNILPAWLKPAPRANEVGKTLKQTPSLQTAARIENNPLPKVPGLNTKYSTETPPYTPAQTAPSSPQPYQKPSNNINPFRQLVQRLQAEADAAVHTSTQRNESSGATPPFLPLPLSDNNKPVFNNPFRELGHRLRTVAATIVNEAKPAIDRTPATVATEEPRFDNFRSLAEHKRQLAYKDMDTDRIGRTADRNQRFRTEKPHDESTPSLGLNKNGILVSATNKPVDDGVHAQKAKKSFLDPEQGKAVLDGSKKYYGTSHEALDCSHFVNKAYRDAGYDYPYITSNGDWAALGFVEVDEPQAGDVIQWKGHVGIVSDPAKHEFIGSHRKGVNYQNWTIKAFTQKGKHKYWRLDPERYQKIMQDKKSKNSKNKKKK